MLICKKCQKYNNDKTNWCSEIHAPVKADDIACNQFISKDAIPVVYLKTVNGIPYISYMKGKIQIAYNENKHLLSADDKKQMENDRIIYNAKIT